MKKKLKLKKKGKSKIKYLFYIFCIYLAYQIGSNFLLDIKLVHNNEEFLKNLINNSHYYNNYEKKSKNIITKFANFITDFDLKKPTTVFEKSFSYKLKLDTGHESPSSDGDVNLKELEAISKHVMDPNPVDVNNPRVYIYNSHQLENYSSENLDIYNITPNVMMASYLLKDKLNKMGIATVAEDSNLIEFMNANNWNHNDSYKASRFYVIDALNKYPNLELLIDLHRDALPKNKSTVNVGGKNYAKTLFVVGMNNANNTYNIDIATELNNIINKKYPSLSRGILKKTITTGNGVYNQDLHPKSVLLEVGAQYNTIDEVLNTIEAISIVIKEYLGAN